MYRSLNNGYPFSRAWDRALHSLVVVCLGPGPVAEQYPQHEAWVWAIAVAGWAVLGLLVAAVWAWANVPQGAPGA